MAYQTPLGASMRASCAGDQVEARYANSVHLARDTLWLLEVTLEGGDPTAWASDRQELSKYDLTGTSAWQLEGRVASLWFILDLDNLLQETGIKIRCGLYALEEGTGYSMINPPARTSSSWAPGIHHRLSVAE